MLRLINTITSIKKTQITSVTNKREWYITQLIIKTDRMPTWLVEWGSPFSLTSNKFKIKKEQIQIVVEFNRRDNLWSKLNKQIPNTNTSYRCKCNNRSNTKWTEIKTTNKFSTWIIMTQNKNNSLNKYWTFTSSSSQTKINILWYMMNNTSRNISNSKMKGWVKGQREVKIDKCNRRNK